MRKLTQSRMTIKVPTEVAVVQGQLANLGERFWFRMLFQVRPGKGYGVNYQGTKLSTVWSAGSIEELLHAVAAAELALASCPGVKQERPWSAIAHKHLSHCDICGRQIGLKGEHNIAHCNAVRLVKAGKALRKADKASK